MRKLLIFFINTYQKIVSPWTPKTCRFYPTCSSYTKQALKKYGVFKGSWLGLKRIVRCHPFNPGGYDPLE
ncbi:MAG: membrane protein insertion efficiency factor YidD [Halanaerobiales bacterium]